MLSPQIPVAKEGIPFIALAAFITIVFALLGFNCLTTIALISTVFILFTQSQAYKVSIFMNVFNVHVNRVPCDGTVERVIYTPGRFYSADSVQGAMHNEYCATLLTTPSGKKIAFVQIAGLIARRIVCWLEPMDTVLRGRRFGLIRFGSRVDLYLPKDTEIKVTVGQKVIAGETIIGYLA
jgi:phosphatidylserine decarboxylase